MSYTIRYYAEFKNIEDELIRLEISEKDYSGHAKEITLSGNPLTIASPKITLQDTMQSTGLEIEIVSEEGDDYSHLSTSPPQTLKVAVINTVTHTTLFKGWIEDRVYDAPFVNPPFVINISASDGLKALKDYKPDFVIPRKLMKLSEILCRTLTYTGFTDDVVVCNSLLSEDMPLNGAMDIVSQIDTLFNKAQVYLDVLMDENGSVLNCKKIIELILMPFNSRIYRSGDKWHIDRINDRYLTGDNKYFITYNQIGDKISDSNSTPSAVLIGEGDKIWVDYDQKLSTQSPYSTQTITGNIINGRPTILGKGEPMVYVNGVSNTGVPSGIPRVDLYRIYVNPNNTFVSGSISSTPATSHYLVFSTLRFQTVYLNMDDNLPNMAEELWEDQFDTDNDISIFDIFPTANDTKTKYISSLVKIPISTWKKGFDSDTFEISFKGDLNMYYNIAWFTMHAGTYSISKLYGLHFYYSIKIGDKWLASEDGNIDLVQDFKKNCVFHHYLDSKDIKEHGHFEVTITLSNNKKLSHDTNNGTEFAKSGTVNFTINGTGNSVDAQIVLYQPRLHLGFTKSGYEKQRTHIPIYTGVCDLEIGDLSTCYKLKDERNNTYTAVLDNSYINRPAPDLELSLWNPVFPGTTPEQRGLVSSTSDLINESDISSLLKYYGSYENDILTPDDVGLGLWYTVKEYISNSKNTTNLGVRLPVRLLQDNAIQYEEHRDIVTGNVRSKAMLLFKDTYNIKYRSGKQFIISELTYNVRDCVNTVTFEQIKNIEITVNQ